MSIRRFFAFFVFVPAFLAPSAAPAGPTWSINSDAKGGVGQLVNLSWKFDGNPETGLAGTLTTKLPSGRAVDTYCVDLHDTTYVGNGGSTWSAEVLPISSFQDQPDGAHWGAIGYLYKRFAPTIADRIKGAALQISLWKVEYDGNASLDSGNFQFADSTDLDSDQHRVYEQVTTYLAGFKGTESDPSATLFRAVAHPNGLYQDLVGPADSSGPDVVNAVPEPASMGMVACGLGAVLIARRRRAAARAD